MTDRDLIGEQVVSSYFGEGTITNSFENSVEIQFSTKTNKFSFASFENTIKAERAEMQAYILKKLYATVTFNFGAHAQVKSDDNIQYVHLNEKIILPDLEAQEGFYLAGWFDGNKTYEPFTPYTIEHDMHFVAQWKHVETPTGTEGGNRGRGKRGFIRGKRGLMIVDPRFDPNHYTSMSPQYTYKELEKSYNIQIQYFGRGINPTKDYVILISRIKADYYVYHDHWTEKGDYIFSGEGKSGDQNMVRGNLAIVNAESENKKILLFLKFSSSEYLYQGVFKLIEYKLDKDYGEDGNLRKEYKFLLRREI